MNPDFDRFLKNLSMLDRLIIILFYSEEMTFKSIGYILNLSESRVLQRHSRLLEKLRQFRVELDDERDDTAREKDSTDSKDSRVSDDSGDDPQDAIHQQSEEP